MKKVFLVIFILLISAVCLAYAQETSLLDSRNKIFNEAKDLKASLMNSRDVILVNSMWDSCILTISQLDAYFSMLGIFNTMSDYGDSSVNYLLNWLKEMQKTNNVNLHTLNSKINTIEPQTRVYIKNLAGAFDDLDSKIGAEIVKVSALKKSKAKAKVKAR